MAAILQKYDPRLIDYRICDTTREVEAAARDRIIFTPTLVKHAPPPHLWVVGDLSNTDVVTDLLQMCGVYPAAATG
jgi:hypothetical protein